MIKEDVDLKILIIKQGLFTDQAIHVIVKISINLEVDHVIYDNL